MSSEFKNSVIKPITKNAVPRFDPDGNIKNSGVTIDDSNNMILPESGDIYTTAWGTWTPTITVSGGTAPTYTRYFVNRWKKIGRTVWFWLYWDNQSGGTAGSGANEIKFTAPFTVSSNYVIGTLATCLGNGQSYEGGGTTKDVTIAYSGSSIMYFTYDVLSAIEGNDQSSIGRCITACGCYETDS